MKRARTIKPEDLPSVVMDRVIEAIESDARRIEMHAEHKAAPSRYGWTNRSAVAVVAGMRMFVEGLRLSNDAGNAK